MEDKGSKRQPGRSRCCEETCPDLANLVEAVQRPMWESQYSSIVPNENREQPERQRERERGE